MQLKLKSASSKKNGKHQSRIKNSNIKMHNSTLELMEKLSLAFATPIDERLLDGDVMSALDRMSIPADLLRTRKL